jgi:hypothetical protein
MCSETFSESQDMLLALQELKNLQLTPEEERVLDEFDEFQRQHPINFSSLVEEESLSLTAEKTPALPD